MKKFFVFILLTLAIGDIYSQELKKITKNRSTYTEKYFVLKSDKKIKQGEYIKSAFGEIIETGWYSNNLKDSLWTYYTLGQQIMSGKYKLGKQIGVWTYYHPNGHVEYIFDHTNDSLIRYNWFQKEPKIQINVNGNWIYEKVDNPPIIVSDYNLHANILENLRFPEEAAERGNRGTVYLYIEISEHGSLCECGIDKGINPILDKEAIRMCEYFDTSWYPAHQMGKRVFSKFIYPIRFLIN